MGRSLLRIVRGRLWVLRTMLLIAALVLLVLGVASGELDLTRIESGTL